MLLAVSVGALAHSAALSEYQVKAAYLLNFARFIDWPEGSVRGSIVVGVLGPDPFGPVLDATLAGKTVHGRPFTVRRYRSAQEIDECHLLFIPAAEGARAATVAQLLARSPVLTVSDAPGFVEAGGVVGFVVENGRVRFDINLHALESAQLKANAQLLEVARTLRRSPK